MLPESELKRIENKYKSFSMSTVMEEAWVWYERLGKFAEWVRGEGFQYLGGIWSSYKYNRSLTTPELINKFLNQLNEGK